MYMAVMERVSEVGTLRAMGTSPAMVFGLFVAEGTVISVVAGCVGLVIGALLIRFFNELAISLPPYPGQSESYPLTFLFSAKIFLWAFGFNVMGGMVASMIPARKAVSFSIVEALRHV
jgi:putative ABC transport system permease protein